MLIYLSNPKITIGIEVNEDYIIIEAPPVVKKFIGQPLKNLIKWMKPDIWKRLT